MDKEENKMNKLSKLTALLLALVLALSVPLGALAESAEIENRTEYENAVRDILQRKIMAYENYGEYWDFASLIAESDFKVFFYSLSEAEQNAMAAYVEALFWASLRAYTKVAPIPELKAVQPAAVFAIQTRGDTESTPAANSEGLETKKSVSQTPDENGHYTITLESYAKGEVVTTTTTTTAPVDIVLVLDFSQSMTNAFDSDSDSSGQHTYTAVTPEYANANKDQTFFVKSSSMGSSGYTEVAWCTQCNAWTNTQSHSGWNHWTQYTPSTSEGGYNSTNKIFYILESTSTDNNDSSIPADATNVEDLEMVFIKSQEILGGKIDFVLHSIGMSPNVRKKRPYDDLDYDLLNKTLDISAVSFHKMIQAAKKLDAINEYGSILALSYVAAQRTFFGYNDMADAKSLLESIARSFGYIYGREKNVRVNTISQSPTMTTAGSGVKGMDKLFDFANRMSPLGNASADECADYCIVMFSDLTRKVTMQNLFHDGGFSSMGMSLRAMTAYERGLEEYMDENGKIQYG